MRNCGKFLLTASALLSFASCGKVVLAPRPTIPLVKEVVAQQAFNPASSEGGIYIIGEPSRVLALRDRFLSCDLRDNVTGRFKRDSLPDFSGETFACVLDSVNIPYKRFLSENKELKLRENIVYEALTSTDEVLHVSPYDYSGMAGKKAAKMMIFASPQLSNCGLFDVDTMAVLAGKSFPVSSPLDAACDRIFKRHKGKLNIGVISRREDIESGAYSAVIQRYARRYGRKGCNVVALEVSKPREALRSYLEQYLNSGNSGSLDLLLVDDPSVSVPEMIRDYQKMTSVMSSESLFYGKVLSDKFEILDAQSSVVQWCYLMLRSKNLFTHDIAYPQAECYYSARRPSGNPESDSPFMMIALRKDVQK